MCNMDELNARERFINRLIVNIDDLVRTTDPDARAIIAAQAKQILANMRALIEIKREAEGYSEPPTQ